MIAIGLLVLLLGLLIKYKFVEINIISENDSEGVRRQKTNIAAYITIAIALLLIIVEILNLI